MIKNTGTLSSILLSILCFAGISSAHLQESEQSPAESLAGKLVALQERFEMGGGETTDLAVSEGELNYYLSQVLAEKLPQGVTAPWIKLAKDEILAGATLDLSLLPDTSSDLALLQMLSGQLPVEIQSGLQTAEGKGKLELKSVSLSGIPLPRSFLQQILSSYTKSPERPDGVRLEDTFLLPYGIRRVIISTGLATVVQGAAADSGKERHPQAGRP